MLLVVDVIDSNYSTTWELFSSGFPSSFLLFSQPLTKDTLPNNDGFEIDIVESHKRSSLLKKPLLSLQGNA
jgi:hypothetical protein